MGLQKLPRFGVFFVLKGTTFRCYILEPVPDVPLVRLWGSIGTRIPIWVVVKTPGGMFLQISNEMVSELF